MIPSASHPLNPRHPRSILFICIAIFVVSAKSFAGNSPVETLRLQPAANMTRAELHFVRTASRPRAVLVLCPGHNGSGEGLIRAPEWQRFAAENNLGLIGLSFASPEDQLRQGASYYHASTGSGEKLLEGIRTIYGRDLPLLLYGFSGGAHFTSRFEQWKPERVVAWCAYSAGWWDEPKRKSHNPPGIVACGDEDDRYGASLIYFKQGRATGHPWIWVSLARTGHSLNPALDDFVRAFFAAALSTGPFRPIQVDVDLENPVTSDSAIHPALTGILPSEKLLVSWQKLHEP